eukprot:TRINITY_DN4207_c1_g1_i3.p1 TRINITY_DN4207_c1_g1~~TRINITY_DN4207_c1_g1_i3.p1  ORF type:complete len:460 (+),score=62.44 TRINITY_DN4207_c1_g1_i3:177-1556(+)
MLFGVICVILASTSYANASDGQQSILDELLHSKQHAGFTGLLRYADLLPVVQSELESQQGGMTIFVPNDDTLMHHTSLTLLAYLKMPENVHILRRTLLHHFLPGEMIGAWTWRGVHKTMEGDEGSDLQLGLEGLSFHVGGVPVKSLNALVAVDGVVHSINGLLVPDLLREHLDRQNYGLVLLEDSSRRELAEAPMAASSPSTPPTKPMKSEPPAFTSSPPVYSPSVSPTTSPAESPMAPSPSPSPTPSMSPGPAPAPDSADLLVAFKASGAFDTLLGLLKETGLLEDLAKTDAPITVLAPTDAAFQNVSNQTLNTLKSDGKLDDVLAYHVITGYYTVDDLIAIARGEKTAESKATSGTLPTLANIPLTVTEENGQLIFGNGVQVAEKDVYTDGQVSVISLDGVLVPPGVLPPAPAPAPVPSTSPSPSPAPAPSSAQGMGYCHWLFTLAAASSVLLSIAL